MVFENKDVLLSAFASYVRQTTIATKRAVMQAFDENQNVTQLFLTYFNEKFNPDSKKEFQRIEEEITNLSIKNIALNTVFSVLKAMTRTNFFKKEKICIAFKFNACEIHRLPIPKPMAEIFITSKEVDAVYLSLGKIARGGIRWSNRKVDLRTEVLQLLKRQQATNATIVPMASKGGFFPKNIPENASKEEKTKYALKAYEIMIRGMLDLMDNVIEGNVISPQEVVCYDKKDPYLIVAIDKSDSDFADLAIDLAKQYNFWLGDMFASGASGGFNRRALGITAQGAWESAKIHFEELGMNYIDSPFRVVGVGSMAGSVFGNGMLVSDKIKLIAAFSSTSIFFDPNPIESVAYQERLRLFKNQLGWSEYNRDLISKGGGVYSRKEKIMTISKEACHLLGSSKTIISPDEMIKLILSAQVDALFFGGVGTYVKAFDETHIDAQDSINSACRINANEIKAKVISEGANLALTQKARVQFALNGGKINADVIDSSASVQCSDYEVNLKILLNSKPENKNACLQDKNQLFLEVQEEVNHKVLKEIKQQGKVLSYMEYRGAKSIPNNKKLMMLLKQSLGLNRAQEVLPEDKEMDQRFNHNMGLTRPELSVLMAYTKIFLKQEILKTSLAKDDFIRTKMLFDYFPKKLEKSFNQEILNHFLADEIVAMMLSNNFVNRMGVDFIVKLHLSSKASVEKAVKAYFIVSQAYQTERLFEFIDEKETFQTRDDCLLKKRQLIAEIERLSINLVKKEKSLDVLSEIEFLKNEKNEKLQESFYA